MSVGELCDQAGTKGRGQRIRSLIVGSLSPFSQWHCENRKRRKCVRLLSPMRPGGLLVLQSPGFLPASPSLQIVLFYHRLLHHRSSFSTGRPAQAQCHLFKQRMGL